MIQANHKKPSFPTFKFGSVNNYPWVNTSYPDKNTHAQSVDSERPQQIKINCLLVRGQHETHLTNGICARSPPPHTHMNLVEHKHWHGVAWV